ncbi:EAL domain-containing protein [Amaricoccus macauensis]|uniref:EAL domain-containing protein n=1 Tax=Amaricoccus macauensis TaxID=57001 RepID=UPI003C7B0850
MARSLRDAVATIGLALALALTSGLAFKAGLLRTADNIISETRMALDKRAASGDFVFLAIDKKSLDAIPVWPWPRSIYGEIVRGLSDGGAMDVYFDIDFSAASNPEMDQAFADAIRDTDLLVVLAAFAQSAGVGESGKGALAFNRPLPLLSEYAWLGAVNVVPNRDGIAREALYGMLIDGEDVASFPSLMSGEFGPPGMGYAINFAIDPKTVPTHSVIDLLHGEIDAKDLSGKTVLVGAHALELRDTFTAPVVGAIPGPLLQIIAAETLEQNLVLRTMSPIPVLAGLCALVIAARLRGRWRRFRGFAVFVLAMALVLESTATYLQMRHQIVLPTAAPHVLLVALLLAAAAHELELRKLFLLLSSREARNTRDILARVIADSGDAVLVVDEDGNIIECNVRWRELFGDSDIDASEGDLLIGGAPPALSAAIREAFAPTSGSEPHAPVLREIEWQRPEGTRHIEFMVTRSQIVNSHGHRDELAVAVSIVCVTARDVTLRREQENRVEYLSRFDPLTGAMRRNEIANRIGDRVAAAESSGELVAVWVFKLLRFKVVNGTLGRSVGDQLLAAVVERLKGFDAGLSLSARLGGNVFAIYNECRTVTPEELTDIAARIAEIIRIPYELEGNTVFTDATIGIASTLDARGETAAQTADLLLDNAETALNEVRLRGESNIGTFDTGLVDRQARARLLERELWKSIENGELFLVYQPQINLENLSFCGAEALVRWVHPELGFVSPGEFIPSAETSGFIQQIGQFVLRKACEDFARSGIPGTIAVNVSPQQFQRGDLLGNVLDVLGDTGLPGTRLHLEMTESLFVESNDRLREMLSDIRSLGVSLALDDFGSGFSSFGYLSRFRIDKIKADQMFVRNLEDNPNNEGILRSIKLLSDELGTKLICEGIETQEQADFLRNIGCDEAQGYFFGKPMPFEELLTFAREFGTQKRAG